MDTIKKCLSVCFVLCLLLTGCSSSSEEDSLSDDVQEEITEEENDSSLTFADLEDFALTGENDENAYMLNTQNGGWAQLTDGVAYMCNDEDYLVSVDADLNVTVLLEESVSYISVYGNVIYFTDEDGDLCCVDLDGSNRTTLVEVDEDVRYNLISDGILYYMTEVDGNGNKRYIYAYDLDTGESTQLTTSISYVPSVVDGYLYYSSYSFMRIDLDGENDTEIYDDDVAIYMIEGDILFYIDDYDTFYVYDLSTETLTETGIDYVNGFASIGDYLYIAGTDGVYKFNKSTYEYELIHDQSDVEYEDCIYNIMALGDHLYYYSYGGDVYFMDTDGNLYDLFG